MYPRREICSSANCLSCRLICPSSLRVSLSATMRSRSRRGSVERKVAVTHVQSHSRNVTPTKIPYALTWRRFIIQEAAHFHPNRGAARRSDEFFVSRRTRTQNDFYIRQSLGVFFFFFHIVSFSFPPCGGRVGGVTVWRRLSTQIPFVRLIKTG